MDETPILTLMALTYGAVILTLVGANVALIVLRVSNLEDSPLARCIRYIGHRASFLRLGGSRSPRHMSDHA